MRVSRDNGVCVQHGDTQIHLDASRIVRDGVTCISHAHADHVRNHYSDLILTPYTSALYPFKRARHKTMPYGVSFDYDGMWVSLHNANHILGSSQFMIEDGSTMVYTGDFRLKESLLGRCEPLECDTLVIEATFGLPEYVFPEPADVYDSIASWTKTSLASGRNVLFGAYALGKSQEIIRVLNQEGITPVVHPKIADFARVYNENGFHLKFVSSLTPEGGAMLSDQFAAIMPTSLMDGRFAHALKKQSGKDVLTAVATGWGARASHADKVFLLSDHADYPSLIEYVRQAKPKKVYTVHGYEEQLAHAITRELGVPARPLASKQTKLEEF